MQLETARHVDQLASEHRVVVAELARPHLLPDPERGLEGSNVLLLAAEERARGLVAPGLGLEVRRE